VVLGITRSGLVVAHEVARLLHMPLDALVVQRIAEPGEPHFSLGAVTESLPGTSSVRYAPPVAIRRAWGRTSLPSARVSTR
jgi:predicted phosphoribosyltransferase